MTQPLVSLIVATYKRDFALNKALISLSQQNYSNLEIILVSDNAEDEWNNKVNAIANNLKDNHPDIQMQLIINEQNMGSAETRNIGIRAANGDYITFLDDDDLYLPEKVNNQVRFMIQNQLDYCITDLYLYDEKERLIDKRIRNYILKHDCDSLLKYHLKYHMTGTDTMMFRKEYLLKIGGFPPIDVGDEFYLMKEAITGGGKFGYLPECSIKAYVHSETDGLSSGDSKIKGENELFAYKKTMFKEIDNASRRYIIMRHHAVLAFAYVRKKQYMQFVFEAIKSFVYAPLSCLSLLASRR